jgi:PAS domain S-box-containing protein
VKIAQHARDIILVIDLDGAIRDCNPAAEAAYGWPREELIGKRIEELRAPETASGIRQQMQEAFERGILFETLHMRRSGERFPCEVSSRAAEVEGRKVLVSVIRDLSERRQAQERFRELLDSLPDGVLIHRGLTILFANRALLTLLGYEHEDELRGRSALELVAGDRETLGARMAKLTSGEIVSVAQREHRLLRKGARDTVIVEVWARLIEFEGAPASMATIHDVTEHRRLEEQLRHAQKMEAVGRLAGGVAHDFNNILTAIQGQGELLSAELPSSSSAHHHVAQLLRAAQRGSALTTQLLAFSRKQVMQPRVVDLNQVVSGLVPMLRRLIGEDLELEIALEPGLRAIRADSGQLEQVIVNLVVNARDAQAARIEIRTYSETASLVMEVRDSGRGMDAGTRARLFEPFFTTKPRGKGTGLGLATVYGIVTQSGGAISVESEPGRGAVFRVTLPSVEERPAGDPQPNAPLPVRGSETVLVVEDDPDVRRFVREVLDQQGYRVLEAEDGFAALESAKRERVDLVISDVIMPRMSGAELADVLKVMQPAPRVLFITGYPGEVVAADPLMKPFSIGDLTRRVRSLLDA